MLQCTMLTANVRVPLVLQMTVQLVGVIWLLFPSQGGSQRVVVVPKCSSVDRILQFAVVQNAHVPRVDGAANVGTVDRWPNCRPPDFRGSSQYGV